MKKHTQHDRRMEQGQITIFVVLALGIFLLAFAGLATDYTNFWFHRQAAQGGADATCQAAAVDLYLFAVGEPTPTNNFPLPVGTPFDCPPGAPATAPAPCIIAKYNGYNGTVADNHVAVSFPTAAPPGVTLPPGVIFPLVQADVTKHAPTYFSRLLSGRSTVDVHASAVCGITETLGPVPIIVLHPKDPATINMNGATSLISVAGGPRQSIQVNSQNAGAVTGGSLATVDLSLGGPDGKGSSFGTFGGQTTKPSSVNLGSTGKWLYPHLPISDPYAAVAFPAPPGAAPAPTSVLFTVDGCPATDGCTEYHPGYYASGIKVHNETAIFVPGLYYIDDKGANNGLNLMSNSIIRVAVGPGLVGDDGNGGIMFYFTGTASVNIDSNSGKPHGSLGICTTSPTSCIVQYHVDGSTEFGVVSRKLQCDGGPAPPALVPATIPGNVLLGPCAGTYKDPKGNRGFLYFQDRASAVDGSKGSGVPTWQGGGSTLAAGFMYFHQCHADHTGTLPCDAPTVGFGDVFHLGGTPGSGSYSVGSLVTDKIYENGNPGIIMILSPDNTFNQIRIGFFQ